MSRIHQKRDQRIYDQVLATGSTLAHDRTAHDVSAIEHHQHPLRGVASQPAAAVPADTSLWHCRVGVRFFGCLFTARSSTRYHPPVRGDGCAAAGGNAYILVSGGGAAGRTCRWQQLMGPPPWGLTPPNPPRAVLPMDPVATASDEQPPVWTPRGGGRGARDSHTPWRFRDGAKRRRQRRRGVSGADAERRLVGGDARRCGRRRRRGGAATRGRAGGERPQRRWEGRRRHRAPPRAADRWRRRRRGDRRPGRQRPWLTRRHVAAAAPPRGPARRPKVLATAVGRRRGAPRRPWPPPVAAGPTGKISWISSHFEQRRSDTHRRNISVCRLQVDPPYSGRGGPPVVKDPGKKLDLMALWLAHNAPQFTVSTHLIGPLRPLTLLLIVVHLNGIY